MWATEIGAEAFRSALGALRALRSSKMVQNQNNFFVTPNLSKDHCQVVGSNDSNSVPGVSNLGF